MKLSDRKFESTFSDMFFSRGSARKPKTDRPQATAKAKPALGFRLKSLGFRQLLLVVEPIWCKMFSKSP
jgi:hypothetical protein